MRFLRRNVRTSQGTFISRNEDKDGVLAWIEDKLALLTGLPADHGEVRWPHPVLGSTLFACTALPQGTQCSLFQEDAITCMPLTFVTFMT